MSEALEKLKEIIESQKRISHVTTCLYWDMRANSPKNGLAAHGEVMAYFYNEAFKLSTSEETGKVLETLSAPEEFEALDDLYKFIVKTLKREYDREKLIPQDLYAEYVEAQIASQNAWEEAKNRSDYSIFAPHLEKLIELSKKMYACTDPGKDVYDAMLDQYERGMDSATIDRLFEDMKRELIPLVAAIAAKPEPADEKFHRNYDIDDQKKMEKILLEYIGFDYASGAVGETEHPFTLNFSSKDVRVSNHFHEDMPLDAAFSCIHEGGHAIFEQNVNEAFDGTVAGSCRYMGIHESQSRFFENTLGRNINFWKPVFPKIQEVLPDMKDISLEELEREINHIRNSFIRTEADELTYCFHIILRYEMEKAIFRDNVPVADLPKLWNQKMMEYLFIEPQNDAEGILQDMHWSDASFGYFPSYLLGTIYDGMFLEEIEKELGSVDTILAEGRILDITKWLNEKIHQYGSTREPKEVIAAVCKREVSAEPIIRHFKEKYTKLYDL